MSEIIRSIEEVEDVILKQDTDDLEYDGYKITTSENVYYILISNDQICCEGFGYICSEDDFNKFINSELKDFTLTNTKCDTLKYDDEYISEDEIQFVNLETSKGLLQFAVYNSHNGYYGHTIFILKNDEVLCEETL